MSRLFCLALLALTALPACSGAPASRFRSGYMHGLPLEPNTRIAESADSSRRDSEQRELEEAERERREMEQDRQEEQRARSEERSINSGSDRCLSCP